MDLAAANPDRVQPLSEAQRALLSLDITVSYRNGARVLNALTLAVARGEMTGLIGSSGSGKSTLAMAILGLLPFKGGSVSGVIEFDGRDLLLLNQRELRAVRGREISFVPQSPISSLNPSLSIATQFREAWRAHSADNDWKPRVCELLSMVGLPHTDDFLKAYPRQLSVGMAQRVLIAMAALHRPKLLIADEPTSALDAISASAILDLFRMLNQEQGTAVLCISHDLASVARLCHRLAILHEGQIVETGDAQTILRAPQHAYARKLVEASQLVPSASEAAAR